MTTRRSTVLIVDDSLALCRFLERALSTAPELDVVGFAHDAFEAREKIKQLEPDVITLDIGLPEMNGLTFLSNLMRLRPMPVVVLSAMVEKDATMSEDARRHGAAEVMNKRQASTREELDEYVRDIILHVRRALKREGSVALDIVATPTSTIVAGADRSRFEQRMSRGRSPAPGVQRVIAIGSSTGGPEALRDLLGSLDTPGCAVLVTQHMPARFMPSFADRLSHCSSLTVKLMEDGERLMPGSCYLAPGDGHMTIVRRGEHLQGQLLDSEAVNGHRPSVDVLFDSVTACAAQGSVGILLTGMGSDGAQALLRMHEAGAPTLVQDEQSSVVWGMPGRAAGLGAADLELPLGHIGPLLSKQMARGRNAA